MGPYFETDSVGMSLQKIQFISSVLLQLKLG